MFNLPRHFIILHYRNERLVIVMSARLDGLNCQYKRPASPGIMKIPTEVFTILNFKHALLQVYEDRILSSNLVAY